MSAYGRRVGIGWWLVMLGCNGFGGGGGFGGWIMRMEGMSGYIWEERME